MSSIKIRQESVCWEKFYPFCPSKLIVKVFSFLSVEFLCFSTLVLNNVCKFLKTCKLGRIFFNLKTACLVIPLVYDWFCQV